MSDQNRPPSDEEDWGPSSPWQQQQPPPQQPPPQQPPPQPPGFQQQGVQPPGFHQPGFQQPYTGPQQFDPRQYQQPQHFQQQQPHRPAQLQNYLVWAIISILLCIPSGVVALVYSTQVNSKLSSGDVAGATKAANNAKLWCIISTALGVVGILVYLASLGSTA
jgi:interferon-induced transmembrane protein